MNTKVSANFTRGSAKVLDLFGTKNWPKLSDGKRADYKAIRSDWENVGRTIERESGRCQKSGIH